LKLLWAGFINQLELEVYKGHPRVLVPVKKKKHGQLQVLDTRTAMIYALKFTLPQIDLINLGAT
jgi:hypothetical protein